MTTAIVAVIYVPPAELDTYGLCCTEICKKEGWEIFGIIPDWNEAAQLKESGKVDLIVVGRSDHVDPTNVPGVIVVAAADADEQQARPERRRPRLLRRKR